jgi:hypothetical protein
MLDEQLAPDEAALRVISGGGVEESNRHVESRPTVDRRQVLEPDQTRQIRETGHIGKGSAADLGLGVCEEPGVGVELHHAPNLVEESVLQRARVPGRCAANADDPVDRS